MFRTQFCTLFAAALGGVFLAGPASAIVLAPGELIISSSLYEGTQGTVTVGQALPNSNGATAVADGSYPNVFNNDAPDGNFGVTSPIFLNSYGASLGSQGQIVIGGNTGTTNVTALSGITTSFSSKSELSLNLSTNGKSLTFMGYNAPINSLDVSNSNTPGNVDPTNSDTTSATFRAVVQVNGDGTVQSTNVNSYSGNNGRAAILGNNVNGTGQSEYLMVGNAGNGSGTEPTNIVNDTGVQLIAPGGASPNATVVGTQQGTPGSSKGFQYGFSVAETNPLTGNPYGSADKSGKDDNFRGETVFNNTLFVTKGSGSNGIDTVYQVGNAGQLPTAGTASSTTITPLPGFPTGLATNIATNNTASEFMPFGIWFANATTLYVADEGPQTLVTKGNPCATKSATSCPDPNAGLEKWTLGGDGQWHLDYVLQTGLNLDLAYSVPNGYPPSLDPWTTGLRDITGSVHGDTVTIFGATSTYSNSGDPGADPNEVVEIVDDLDATTLPTAETFTTIDSPSYGTVFRGVALDPVSEPSSLAAMAASLLALGMLRRRRAG